VTCSNGLIFDEASFSCVCPASSPYVDANGRCVACNAPNYWNVNSKACLSCAKDTHWDPSTGKCECCP
jgi:hypothetical protein